MLFQQRRRRVWAFPGTILVRMSTTPELSGMNVETDVELLSTIETILSEQAKYAMDERRTDSRRSYDCTQLLAPFDGESLPQQADFRQVQCRELSPSGFSFYTYRQPDSDQVVVALGAVPFKFFIAEIVHMSISSTEGGQDFLVGCQFVNRLGV